MKPIILAVAPNGAYKQKTDHQQIPITDRQIIETAMQAELAGANMLHLHIRDGNNNHSIDPNHYRDILLALKEKTSLLVQVTSESANIFTVDQQIKMIEQLKPEFVSIALREIMRTQSTNLLQDLFQFMRQHKISPQIILYDLNDAQQYLQLLKDGVFKATALPVLYVAGKPSSLFTTIAMLDLSHANTSSWMICGFGSLEYKCLLLALALDGNIRIGFENNLNDIFGKQAQNNQKQIQASAKLIEQSGKTLALYDEVKKLMTPMWQDE